MAKFIFTFPKINFFISKTAKDGKYFIPFRFGQDSAYVRPGFGLGSAYVHLCLPEVWLRLTRIRLGFGLGWTWIETLIKTVVRQLLS